MSADRDLTRLVRSWLRTDEHESANHVLDAVLDQLDATPQRRPWWPVRRFDTMNTYAKVAVAAVAVVALALVGFKLLPGNGQVGGPVATPVPTTAPSPSASPTPVPTPWFEPPFPASGELPVGRTVMTQNGVRMSLAFERSGWKSNGSWGIGRGAMEPTGAELIFWGADIPIGVYSDPCAHVEAPPAGPSAAERAAAVASLAGTTLVSGPSDLSIDGHPAKLTVITVREDAACPGGENGFYLWYSPGNNRWASALGSTYRVWIIDVNGTFIWIDGETFKGAGPEVGAELEQIVNSIQFE